MRRYLDRYDALDVTVPPRPGAGTVSLVVAPWVFTPVPWYSVMLGIGLARRGRPFELIWDDTGFPEPRVAEQNRVIGEVLRDVARSVTVHRVSEAPVGPSAPGDDAVVAALAEQNLLWRLRGGEPGPRTAALPGAMLRSLEASLPRIRSLVHRDDLDLLVVPGGIYGTSGLFLHTARERGLRVATFDVDRATAQICVDGIAAQNHDIPRAFETVWERGPAARAAAGAEGRAEFEKRLRGRDRYGFQMVAADPEAPSEEIAALIPMNVIFDSAALGRHVHFADTAEWITETVAAVIEEDAGPVVVRQHPSERRRLQRSSFAIDAILRDRFGDDRRVRFVAADDPTSTYDLLRAARVVLPFVSTIGIESAAIGKPTLIAGSCFYGPLGFVHTAASRDEYLALVRRGVHGELPLLPEQQDRAWVCYCMCAVENRVPTDFTTHPDEFWHWSTRPPDVLFADQEVADIFEALDTDVPVSLLRHDRRSRV
jgi:hypothetical protein